MCSTSCASGNRRCKKREKPNVDSEPRKSPMKKQNGNNSNPPRRSPQNRRPRQVVRAEQSARNDAAWDALDDATFTAAALLDTVTALWAMWLDENNNILLSTDTINGLQMLGDREARNLNACFAELATAEKRSPMRVAPERETTPETN